MSRSLLTTHDIQCSTAVGPLFSHVSLSVQPHDRIGLVGKNGVGKTTLFHVLAGATEPDVGTMVRHSRVRYVPQVAHTGSTTKTLHELLESHGCASPSFTRAYTEVFGACPFTPEIQLTSCSGGELTKIHIACAVSERPDVLLLDEPTNHLDRTSIEQLREWLTGFTGAVVVASHNRTFLDAVVRDVWELANGTLTLYGGTYTDYIRTKAHERDAQARMHAATKKELAALKEGERMREVKAARAARTARKLKNEPSRSPSAENYFKNRSEKGIGSIKKKHDEQEEQLRQQLHVHAPSPERRIHVPLVAHGTKRRMVVDARDVTVATPKQVLVRGVTLQILYGDRIAISGDNGTGKTVLLKTLLGDTTYLTDGEIRHGSVLETAYIDQRYDMVDTQVTLYENIAAHMDTLDAERVHKQLGLFHFPEHYVHRSAGALSGGEIARLAFAIATVRPLDLLALDEPTNNLDIETIDIIHSALNAYTGALLVVSHDAFFVEALNVDRSYEIMDHMLVHRH